MVVFGFSDNLVAVVVVCGSSDYRFLNLDSLSDIRGWTLVSFKGLLPDIKVSLSPDNWDSWGGGFQVDLNSYVLGGAVFTTVLAELAVGFAFCFGLEDFVPPLKVYMYFVKPRGLFNPHCAFHYKSRCTLGVLTPPHAQQERS